MSQEAFPKSSDPTKHPIKVVVADATALGTQLIWSTLQAQVGIEPFISGITLDRFTRDLKTIHPEIALIGAASNEGGAHAIEMVRVGRGALPGLPVVVMLDATSHELAVEAFRAGARGVFCRDDSVQDLVLCLENVHEGQVWAKKCHLLHVVQALAISDPALSIEDARGRKLLSKRETEIVQGVTDGLTNRDIAVRLQLSQHTIKNYLLRIFDRLGVSNRAELVSYVLHGRSRRRAEEQLARELAPTDSGSKHLPA